MDSEEDDHMKRRLRSASVSASQVWRIRAVYTVFMDNSVAVLHVFGPPDFSRFIWRFSSNGLEIVSPIWTY